MRATPFGARHLKLIIGFLLAIVQHNCFSQSTPLINAFAHNDYCHKRPLFDALDNGFANIEADVFLEDTSLVVAHVCPLFRHSKTLERLYLKPLYNRVMQNNGSVYSNYSHPVILMIDFKSGANDTYMALERLLNKYRSMFTRYENGQVIEGAVTVVISGHKPYFIIENETSRLAFIDDDLRKVAQDTLVHNVFTMASCRYSHLLSWTGKGPMPLYQRQRLCDFVTMAHRIGSKVRLWASPENKVVWNELLSCGVDLINTDQLVTLRNYLNSNTTTMAKVN